MVSENFIQIDQLGTDIQNFGEEVRFILYDVYLFEKYGQYQKKLSAKQFYFLILRLYTKFCRNQFFWMNR